MTCGDAWHWIEPRRGAEKVAHVGLTALAAGKSSVISGFKNWLGAETVRMFPPRMVAQITAGMFRPKENRA